MAELNPEQLETVYGGPIKEENLPDKFKEINRATPEEPETDPDELDANQLGNIYGGPIKPEDLPDNYYTDKNQDIMGR